ncbi:MAG: phosphatase PAP2 family protein [Ferruginibacter sp.]
MWTALQNWDRWLFTKINQDWTNTFLDNIFPLWREAITWFPLYVFLLLFVLINFGKKSWPWIIGFLTTVALSDQISSHVIKQLFNRPRPCHDIILADHIRLLLDYCSDSRSFISSHATNHFGIAFFIYFTLKPYFQKWGYLFFFWAATISYGQVYIGVHYPTDVIGGALVGSFIGYFVSWYFNKKIGLPAFVHQNDHIISV